MISLRSDCFLRISDTNISHFENKVNLIKRFLCVCAEIFFLFSIDKLLEIWYNDKREIIFMKGTVKNFDQSRYFGF